MNVLDMLQAYLAQNVGFAQQEEGQSGDSSLQSNAIEMLQRQVGRGEQPRPAPPTLPDYLPEAVRRSIMGQPSYGEGQWMPRAPNPALDEETLMRLDPRREGDLADAMSRVRGARQGTDTIPDAFSDADWINGNYSWRRSSPLNSMMGRYPLALY